MRACHGKSNAASIPSATGSPSRLIPHPHHKKQNSTSIYATSSCASRPALSGTVTTKGQPGGINNTRTHTPHTRRTSNPIEKKNCSLSISELVFPFATGELVVVSYVSALPPLLVFLGQHPIAALGNLALFRFSSRTSPLSATRLDNQLWNHKQKRGKNGGGGRGVAEDEVPIKSEVLVIT